MTDTGLTDPNQVGRVRFKKALTETYQPDEELLLERKAQAKLWQRSDRHASIQLSRRARGVMDYVAIPGADDFPQASSTAKKEKPVWNVMYSWLFRKPLQTPYEGFQLFDICF